MRSVPLCFQGEHTGTVRLAAFEQELDKKVGIGSIFPVLATTGAILLDAF
jgi:hypothetical protein